MKVKFYSNFKVDSGGIKKERSEVVFISFLLDVIGTFVKHTDVLRVRITS